MRIFFAFFFHLQAAIIFGAALAYPFHFILGESLEVEPRRLVSRLGLLVALLGFIGLLRLTRLENRPSLGLALPLRAFLDPVRDGMGLGSADYPCVGIDLVVSGDSAPGPAARGSVV